MSQESDESEPSAEALNAPASKTVFIVGAGASNEVGLPLGDGLADAIGHCLNLQYSRGSLVSSDSRSIEIDRALRAICGQYQHVPVPVELQGLGLGLDELVGACHQTSRGMILTPSIDNYLNSHRQNSAIAVCGKLAITLTILREEAKSDLQYTDKDNFIKRRIDFSTAKNAWYRKMLHVLVAPCDYEELKVRLKSVAFVIFNYDRCVEHYLFHALQDYYGRPATEIADLLRQVEFYHPYGKVGSLPWEAAGSRAHEIDFGFETDADKLLALSTQIRTFHEGVQDSAGQAIRQVVRAASKLIFLGFAFHRLNMKLLFGKSTSQEGHAKKSVYGTAYGVFPEDLADITNQICTTWKVQKQRIHLDPQAACAAIFAKHTRGISL
jgi:hypothetical protein